LRYANDAARAAIALRPCNEVGTGARCIGRVVVKNEGRIVLGRDVRLNAPWSPIELAAGPGAELRIGSDIDINYGTLISAAHRVTIGDRVMMGNYCIVADTEEAAVGGRTRQGSSREPPRAIEIGDDAWLAVRVTVLPGTTIGQGAVITAGSVVSGNIPPGVVAGGIPARVLRSIATPGDRKANELTGTAGTSDVAEPGVRTPATAVGPAVRLRGTLISDFTIDELSRQLGQISTAVGLEGTAAPFGQVVQALMEAPSDADFAVVWTRPEAVVPSFARIASFDGTAAPVLAGEVEQFCDLVARAAANFRFVFVPTWTAPAYDHGLGLLSAREGGAAHALAAMNLRLMDALAKVGNVYVLDAQRWLSLVGKGAYSPKLWHLGKVPFHSAVFAEAARDIHAAVVALRGGARKLLVVDLDDTLWGGIVGDVGWENLRLGGHDGLGEAFVDFQRALKDLTRRGLLLAIASKNEESTALDAIRSHPEMVLRESDFVARRINWNDKAQNIADLTRELNLGLQSVVFIDDNPVERARVREALPEVFVPEWPEDKHQYRSALAALRCFDAPVISQEDAERTALYAAERQRESLQSSVGSIEEWLKGLGVVVTAEPVGPSSLPRTVQLLNKTNQMNLTTRRLTEAELMDWVRGPGRSLWTVRVRDRFGDAGLTGIVSVEIQATVAQIVDFVLSCRVMGRKVEDTMAHIACEHARSRGAARLQARLIPTAKNKPCLTFWKGSAFACEEETCFVWDASQPFPLPETIELEWKR
jgi:FkbH-like protein